MFNVQVSMFNECSSEQRTINVLNHFTIEHSLLIENCTLLIAIPEGIA